MLVTSIKDRNGNTQSFTYDAQYRLEKVTDDVGRELNFTYQTFALSEVNPNRLTSVTGPDGVVLEFSYDRLGYLQTAKRAERIETYEYASEQTGKLGDYNLVTAIDTNGHSTRYSYYGPGEISLDLKQFTKVLKSQDVVKQVLYPDGHAAAFQYDLRNGNQRIVTDLRGNDTVYTLNFVGNPLKIEEPLGKTTQMTWSIDQGLSDNVMTSRTDALGRTTLYKHDAKGNVIKEIDPYSNVIETTWDQDYSLPLTRTDRNGVEQRWTYDPTITGCLNSHEVEVEEGVFSATLSDCYATGEVKSVTDPLNNVSRTTYDLYGNPDLVTVAEGTVDEATTDFDYDVRGRKVAETDPLGHQTLYAYDNLDYLASITYPALTSYALPFGSTNVKLTDYDAQGNLLSETDRVGQTLTYIYTPRNQVKTITRSSGGVKSFVYDANGNLTSETDWKGMATTHSYDALNRRDITTNRLGDRMAMAYDLAGNLTQVTDFEGRVTDYEYDDLNRQTRVIQPKLANQAARGEIVTTYYNEADPKSNVATVTDAEGNLTSFEYNGRYQKTKRNNALFDAFVWQYDDAGNLEKTIDEELNEIRFAYDAQNRRTITYAKLDAREFTAEERQYDAVGNVRFVIDALGNSTEAVYDEWNRPWQSITPLDTHAGTSYTTSTELDGEGREVKITDGNNNVRSFLRDARGLVLTATDAELNDTLFTYDLNGNLVTITNARGFITRTGYDAEDRKLLTVAAEGMAEERTSGVVQYDKVGNALQVRDGNGNISVTQFNVLNLPSKQFDPAPFSANFVEVLYNKNGQPVSVKNRLGHTTTTSYDALGRVDTVTDPAPFQLQTLKTTYDKVGNVRTVKDKRNIISETIYDELYRPVEQYRDGIRLITNEYDDAGNLTATIDAENNRVEYAYNSRNLLERTSYIDPAGVDYFTEQFYDGVGNLVTHSNEEGEVTTTTYDKENRQKTIEFANETTENVYDEVGNLIQIIKPKLNGSVMAYDGLNRLTSVTEGNLLTTAYTYDANNNQLSQTDPLGHLVEFTYDELNRKKQHIQRKPSSSDLIVSYDEYDAEGNLKQMTDAKGQVFGYEYDELNRLTTTNYPVVTTPFITIEKIETVYDANNNIDLVTETKQYNSAPLTDITDNTWDNFDRLVNSAQTHNDNGISVPIDITYGYDNNGNRTLVSTENGSTTYEFDHRIRLQKAITSAGETVYTYTPDGQTDTITYANGAVADYDYDATNRTRLITHTDGSSQVISSFSHLYDGNGNRTQQIANQGGTSETTDYVYDDLDRLANFTVSSGADIAVTDYTFEGYNRKTETVSVNGTLTTDKVYIYDETNWLDSVTDAVAGTSVSYIYDENGNTISKTADGTETSFSYDVANRLVETIQSGITLGQYDYNADGMRIRHYQSERGNVEYFYDDGAVLEEFEVGASGGLLAHYRYGDRLLSLDTGTESQYYHHDALGSTVNLTDGAGIEAVNYTLDPWGMIKDQGGTGTTVNRQVFTGQEHDEQTGLIYFGARYYDPDTARFISQDSYLGEAGTPPSLHRYLYAYSNPTVWVDLSGNVPVLNETSDYLHEKANEIIGFSGQVDKGAGGVVAGVTAGLVGGSMHAVAGVVDLVNTTENLLISAAFPDSAAGRQSKRELDEIYETVFMVAEDPSGTATALKKSFEAVAEGTMTGDPESIAKVVSVVPEAAMGYKGAGAFKQGVSATADLVENAGKRATGLVAKYGKNGVGVADATVDEFIGPLIGKSGFKSSEEFAKESFRRYQSYVDDAYENALISEAKGLLKGNRNTRIGSAVDRESATRYGQWLTSEGLAEGHGKVVQMNRWLVDPLGSGKYVRPDIHIPTANVILDATVGKKWSTSRQISRFKEFSGGDKIINVRPQQLGGSYSIWP